MKSLSTLAVFVALLSVEAGAAAQQSPATPGGAAAANRHVTIVRGCLQGERGNYILVDDNSMVYVLKGVGTKLDRYLRHDVEVRGRMLPGSIKTGVRLEKTGSNPSDTVHAVDGVPLQLGDVQHDIRTISKRCKAAEEE